MTTTAKRLLLVFLLLLPCAPARAGADKFWVWDLTVMPPAFRQPTFTKVGEAPLAGNEKVSVWVEDGLGAHAPTPEQLGALVPLYARAIDLERGTFGAQPTPPSRDRDFHVLIAAIPPYESHGRKFGFDGFFNAFDQLSEKDAREQGQHSNERNIIYVNALQDVNGDYMRAVVVHELNHLITHGQYDGEKNALDPWVNEMLGESAMQLAGYFTDVKHVQAYRAHPEWPLAVMQYGVSYGGLSLLAEYLMARFETRLIGRVAPAAGDGFARLASVYGVAWNDLFAGYARWLFEERSAFPGDAVAVRSPETKLGVAPSGVLYLPESYDAAKLAVTAAPKTCEGSKNVVRNEIVHRADTTARAIWVESVPPCAAVRGETKFDSFTLERK